MAEQAEVDVQLLVLTEKTSKRIEYMENLFMNDFELANALNSKSKEAEVQQKIVTSNIYVDGV